MCPKKSFLFCIFFLVSAISVAQNISMEETLAYINGKLSSKYEIDVKRGLLLLTSYKDNMKMMDETILITDLNPEVVYSEEEKAIIIKCNEGDKCVERKEHLVEKKNYFSRLKIVTPEDEKSVKGLQKAFLHLLRLVQEPKYKSTETFE
ncbi:MAG: hypothetical protein POELPBGB_00730 [Bacteroidia bacterium]|nr:hypothetical protein [Bacteroidia bacterium]